MLICVETCLQKKTTTADPPSGGDNQTLSAYCAIGATTLMVSIEKTHIQRQPYTHETATNQILLTLILNTHGGCMQLCCKEKKIKN